MKVSGLRRVIKPDLGIEFGSERLTSYGGLELFRRYFQGIGLNQALAVPASPRALDGPHGAIAETFDLASVGVPGFPVTLPVCAHTRRTRLPKRQVAPAC